eukprot:gene7662-31512_t
MSARPGRGRRRCGVRATSRPAAPAFPSRIAARSSATAAPTGITSAAAAGARRARRMSGSAAAARSSAAAGHVEMGSCRPYIYAAGMMGVANGRGAGFAKGYASGHKQGLLDANPDSTSAAGRAVVGGVPAWGPTKGLTDNLDRLAAGGVRFTDFHVGASVCAEAPAHARPMACAARATRE